MYEKKFFKMKKLFIYLTSMLLLLGCISANEEANQKKPNIVLIYADDLGWGDVECYDDRSKIPTPNIDKLAENGVRFTSAYSPDAICSPSRYGLLTGQYSWRTGWTQGNPEIGSQLVIEKGRLTIANMLKDAGYNTAAIGKWGLSADWESAAKPGRQGLDISADAIDYSKPVHSGHLVGFTYDDLHRWYGRGYHETYYESNMVDGAFEKSDGGRWYFENGISRGGDPDFEAFDMEEAQMYYINQTVKYIDANGGRVDYPNFNLKEGAPFFVYYCPHIPHWPHVPAKQFQGKTNMGYYGDFVYQLDWAVGQILEALERNNMLDNTLIIFTSDNGPEVQTYEYINDFGHFSMGSWRGLKRTVWEAGHRVPFIVSWKDKVPQGKVTDAMVSQTDILATVAQLIGTDLSNDGAEDSYSFLDEIIPEAKVENERNFAIYHSATGKLAIRQEEWVFVNDSTGDVGNQEPQWYREMIGAVPHELPYELFNLNTDPQQTTNVAAKYPEKLKELQDLLQKYIGAGRTIER
jgi:arylsulfatase A